MNLLALKKAEDGKGWILRLCDSSGLYQRKCVVFGDAVHKIWSCSLTEEKQGELPIRDKKIEFDSAPFEIHTLYVEIEQK